MSCLLCNIRDFVVAQGGSWTLVDGLALLGLAQTQTSRFLSKEAPLQRGTGSDRTGAHDRNDDEADDHLKSMVKSIDLFHAIDHLLLFSLGGAG